MLLGKDYQATSAEDSEIAKEFEMVNYLFYKKFDTIRISYAN
ncbi:hypothetical protein BH18ACI1_BH18ACI1_23050 [soil metagenome]